MKLYQRFLESVKQLGEIKLAWFTSFNIDLYFFEKYILPAIVNQDPEQLRNLKDYEILNEMFHQREADGKAKNVRLFYDFRANNSRDSKKTCVQTIPVNPDQLSGKSKFNFKGGVFHPKISLLVNYKDEAIILATSANLTIGGWAQNSECAIFKKIEDKQNANRIVDFFRAFVNDEDRKELEAINHVWQESFKESDDWYFLSSFDNINLLESINPANKSLHVWSPYFSDDLPEIISNHLKSTELYIIPDIPESNKIRISELALMKLKELERVSILKDGFDFKTESKPFVHAKTWITDDKLAIGSWNFTQAGLNSGKAANNIEAGIILNINEKEFKSLQNSFNLKKFEDCQGMTIDELESERNESLKTYSYSCQIFADWAQFRYFIPNPEQAEENDYYAQLPGLDEKISLNDLKSDGISFLENYKTLLKDRLFSVFDAKNEGNVVFVGIITEINTHSRPALAFQNINDLINAWLAGEPKAEHNRQVLNFTTDEETGEEINSVEYIQMSEDYSGGWFKMFLAIGEILKKLKEAYEDDKELRKIAFHIPGSLIQLHEQVENLKAADVRKSLEYKISDAFLWFLIHEANSLFRFYNQNAIKKGLKTIEEIKNIKIKTTTNNKNFPNKQVEKWLESIVKEYYAN